MVGYLSVLPVLLRAKVALGMKTSPACAITVDSIKFAINLIPRNLISTCNVISTTFTRY